MGADTSSVLADVAKVVNRHLFAQHERKKNYCYWHKRSWLALCESPPENLRGRNLISEIYQQIEKNLKKRPTDRKPSIKNWTLRSLDERKTISPIKASRDDEVSLERAIVHKWPDRWSYQMPTASGLFSQWGGKKHCVDLVHIQGKSNFDFIELKLPHGKAGHPVYAAFEILGYGLLYLAARTDVGASRNEDRRAADILSADEIRLCVLAPKDYYQNKDVGWLSYRINEGLKHIIAEKMSLSRLEMRFRFEAFSDGFTWPPLNWDGKRCLYEVQNPPRRS